MPFLEINNLHKHFTKRSGGWLKSKTETIYAVNGVNLSLEKGEILGLVGESGCGKSTLSRALMQLIEPTSGSVVLDGVNLTQLQKHSASQVRALRLDFQMIFQDPYASLNPRMTIASALQEALNRRHPSISKEERLQRIIALMERVGLDASVMKKYPHEFSGGQRQRIAIARALAPEPKLIIADEPVSALDVSIQSQILNLLLQLRNDLGLTMIFISHDLGVVRYIADNIAVMYEGKIIEYAAAEEVFHNPQQDYTKRLLSAIPQLPAASCA
jgi:ABC-type oligopeptide transport system ATPase subunit